MYARFDVFDYAHSAAERKLEESRSSILPNWLDRIWSFASVDNRNVQRFDPKSLENVTVWKLFLTVDEQLSGKRFRC